MSLQKRGITMHDYIEAMEKMKTSGLDITVLIVCEMFQLSCVVLIDDFMWKSTDICIEDFDIYLLMYKGGRFVSATKNDGSKILVTIPKCEQSVIDAHPYPCTFKPIVTTNSSGTDGEDQAKENDHSQLNNGDTMISTADAFSGRFCFQLFRDILK